MTAKLASRPAQHQPGARNPDLSTVRISPRPTPPPETVGSRFLSLLQSAPAPNFLRHFPDREKAQLPRTFAHKAWGFVTVTLPAEFLSEWRFVSEAWGLADLLYKLFWQRFQKLSLVANQESRYPFRPLRASLGTANRPTLGPKPLKNMRHLIPAHLPRPEPTPNARQCNMGAQRAMWSFD